MAGDGRDVRFPGLPNEAGEGLAIWKSVQFPLLRELMGGYDNARVVHFSAMSLLAAFLAVHLAMVALVPRSLLLMIRGR